MRDRISIYKNGFVACLRFCSIGTEFRNWDNAISKGKLNPFGKESGNLKKNLLCAFWAIQNICVHPIHRNTSNLVSDFIHKESPAWLAQWTFALFDYPFRCEQRSRNSKVWNWQIQFLHIFLFSLLFITCFSTQIGTARDVILVSISLGQAVIYQPLLWFCPPKWAAHLQAIGRVPLDFTIFFPYWVYTTYQWFIHTSEWSTSLCVLLNSSLKGPEFSRLQDGSSGAIHSEHVSRLVVLQYLKASLGWGTELPQTTG